MAYYGFPHSMWFLQELTQESAPNLLIDPSVFFFVPQGEAGATDDDPHQRKYINLRGLQHHFNLFVPSVFDRLMAGSERDADEHYGHDRTDVLRSLARFYGAEELDEGATDFYREFRRFTGVFEGRGLKEQPFYRDMYEHIKLELVEEGPPLWDLIFEECIFLRTMSIWGAKAEATFKLLRKVLHKVGTIVAEATASMVSEAVGRWEGYAYELARYLRSLPDSFVRMWQDMVRHMLRLPDGHAIRRWESMRAAFKWVGFGIAEVLPALVPGVPPFLWLSVATVLFVDP